MTPVPTSWRPVVPRLHVGRLALSWQVGAAADALPVLQRALRPGSDDDIPV